MGFFAWNLKTNDFHCSNEIFSLYGIDPSKEHPTFKLIMGLVHPGDLEFVQKNLDMALQGILDYDLDHRILRTDGSVLRVHAQAKLTRDSEGAPSFLLGTVVDITDCRQVEDELRENEGKYRSLFKNINDFVQSVTSDGRIIEVNPAWRQLMGYTKEEALKLNFMDIIHPRSQKHCLEVFKEVMSGKPVKDGKAELITKYRRVIIVDADMSPMFRDGKPYASWCVFKDLTEPKLKENELQESEKRHRAVLEATVDPIVVYNSTGETLYLNPAFTMVFGWTLEELLNKKIPFVPDENMDETIDAIKKCYSDGYYTFETRRFTKDGDILDIAAGGSIWQDSSGEPQGIVVNFKDISERKRSEELLLKSEKRYRNLFENSRDAIYMTARKGEFISVNQAMLDLFGYTKDEMVGMNILELYNHIEQKERSLKKVDVQGHFKDREVTFKKKDGTKITCLLTGTVRRGNEGEILGYQGIVRDITEHKQMEEAILKKNKELESFVYTVSHDLKSPLVSLYGFIEELLEENKEKFSEDSKHMAERIVANVDKIEELINDLMDLSRVGRIVGSPVEIKLKELFEQLAMEFDKRLRAADIKLKVSQKDDCVICAAPDQVHRVMDNLLSNAVKFMGDTDDRKIELICRKKDKSHVQICVKDNGIGIDRKYHEKIFELFRRLDVNKNAEGTGVGLTLVQRTVEDFGGRVWVESEPGKGAEFWVELPEKSKERRIS